MTYVSKQEQAVHLGQTRVEGQQVETVTLETALERVGLVNLLLGQHPDTVSLTSS